MSVSNTENVITYTGAQIYDPTGPRFKVPVKSDWKPEDAVFEIWPPGEGQRTALQGEVTTSGDGLYWYITPTPAPTWTADLTGWQITIFNRPRAVQMWSPSNQTQLDYKGLEAALDRCIRLAQASMEIARRSFQIHPKDAPPFTGQEATIPEVTVSMSPGAFLAIDESGNLTTRQGVTETYNLTPKGRIISKDPDGLGGYTANPSKVGAYAYRQGGTGGPIPYAGRFTIETTSNWTDYTEVYRSTANETECELTITNLAITGFRLRLFPGYWGGDLSALMDESRVTVIEAGVGLPGNYYETRYMRAGAQPSTPTGDDPIGWTTFPPNGSDPLYSSVAMFTYDGVLQGTWSTPTLMSGVSWVARYLGAFTTDPAGALEGDWYLNKTSGQIFFVNGGTWAVSTREDHISAAMADLVQFADESTSNLFVAAIAAKQAFIEALSTKTIKSANYDTITDGSRMRHDFENGETATEKLVSGDVRRRVMISDGGIKYTLDDREVYSLSDEGLITQFLNNDGAGAVEVALDINTTYPTGTLNTVIRDALGFSQSSSSEVSDITGANGTYNGYKVVAIQYVYPTTLKLFYYDPTYSVSMKQVTIYTQLPSPLYIGKTFKKTVYSKTINEGDVEIKGDFTNPNMFLPKDQGAGWSLPYAALKWSIVGQSVPANGTVVRFYSQDINRGFTTELDGGYYRKFRPQYVGYYRISASILMHNNNGEAYLYIQQDDGAVSTPDEYIGMTRASTSGAIIGCTVIKQLSMGTLYCIKCSVTGRTFTAGSITVERVG